MLGYCLLSYRPLPPVNVVTIKTGVGNVLADEPKQ